VREVTGTARLLDARTVAVASETFTADRVLVATGGRPRVPVVPGAGLGITSDGFFALREQPRSVAVIGGGYVAVELGAILRALGSEVTLVLRGEQPLRGFDGSLRRASAGHLEASGITLVRGREVARLEGGQRRVTVLTGGGEALGPFECVLWAIGRTPSTEGLGLEAASVATTAEGHVVVDAWQASSAPGVFAVGDVTGRVPLTPVAIAAGRRLADRLFGGEIDARLDYEGVPTVVFSLPPLGTVGLSEEEARDRHGAAVRVYERSFTNLHHALTARRPRSTVKLVTVGPDERVVGVHAIGPGADEMIQGFAVALRMGAKKADLDRTIAVHPTAAEELVTLR
jgi:glutathione reductase (NADPH)